MNTEIKFPNYQKIKNSPSIAFSEGIAISSIPAIVNGEGEAFPLYGTFKVPEKIAEGFKGNLMNAVVVLIRGPNPATLNVGGGQLLFPDDLYTEGNNICGYFNMDLFEFFNLVKAPNRYYVSASIFQYVSNVLTVEVVEKQ